jgi:gliding motility-associated-like protein
MRNFNFILLLFLYSLASLLSSPSLGQTTTGSSNYSEDSTDLDHKSEEFWASINFLKLKNEIGNTLHISGSELDLFNQYLQKYISDDAVNFFTNAPFGGILPSQYASFLEEMKQRYIALYPTFVKVKSHFIAELAAQKAANDKPQAANGPCTNIGFESGTLNGWAVKTGTACGTGTCNLNATTNPGCHAEVTNKTMTDPWIPSLPTVSPTGGNYSMRLENYQNGFGQTSLSQTFQVTATNNVFTYQYAVVLEDPVTGHTDDQRPYFEVKMFDGAGKEITCATYTRIAAGVKLVDYIHNPVPNPPLATASDGCPYGGPANGANSTRDLWYKPWTTVSIALTNYIGQNVTILFTASDCALGGHLGYAYIDAACSSINPVNTTTICGNQSVSYTGTPGFETYIWERLSPPPAPDTISLNQNVSISQSGTYRLTMVPFSDNAEKCPTTQNFSVLQHCPQSISTTMCENPKGSGTFPGINLNNYNAQILNYNNSYAKTLVSWHSGYPVSAGNKVTSTSITVANNSKYYALITYDSPVVGSDTAVLNFIINLSPVLTFPPIGPLCVGSAAVTLSASPAGGTYSGTAVSGNQFNPATLGSYIVTYSYTDANGCSNTIDRTILVQPPPTVNAGPDQTVCGSASTIALGGTATNTTSVLWTTDGGGTLTPNNTSNIIYTPTASERTNGATVTMTLRANGAASCPFVTDQVVITIVPQATVNAGPDQTLCAPASFALSGTSTFTTGVAWTITSGSNGGSVSPPNSANATYTTSAAERTNGATITLSYSGTPASPCPVVKDQVVLKIIPVATVNAGPDQTVCATSVALAGAATNYTSVSWQTSAGATAPFSPVNTLSSVYTPTAAETANGATVTVTLTAFAIAPCPNVTDQAVLTISPVATVNAGQDQTLCADAASTVSLSGTATNASGGTTWTRNGVAIATNPTSLNTTYTPTASELLNGATITFTLTASAASPCPAVSDQVIITIIPVATVNAGPDQLICASTGSFALTGTVTNAAGGVQWTSNGTGTIITPNSLNATYLPSASEKNSGATITMTLTATPASPCTPISDVVVLTIAPVATVDAGIDQLICANTTSVSLSGAATNASGGVAWTSSGSGSITSGTSLNATYTPSASELLSGGTITLTLTATPANPCPVVSDPMILTVIPQATVNAGIDPTICANSGIVSLSGTATHNTQVKWTGGGGIFAPANSLNTIYIPSSSELSSGAMITVTLTATAVSPCPVVQDQAVITIVPVATVDAGSDHSICASTNTVLLSGTSSNGASVAWTTNSTGSFSPANASTTTYTLSPAEIISGGTVTLTLTVTANSPCPPVSDQAIIIIIPVPTVNAGPDQNVCADKASVTLAGVVSNAQGGTWSGGSGSYTPGSQTLTAGYKPSKSEMDAGVATLTLTTRNNPLCTTVSDVMNIFIHPLPVVNLGPDQKLCPESDPPVFFNAGPGSKFLWQPTGDTTQTIGVSAGGTYTVTVFNQWGCSSGASANVVEVCPPRLFISNSFSPNGDGNNDNYNVYGAHFKNFHMFIFNRWGEIIFESKDRDLVWDGVYREVPMPIGVYPWIITYEGDSEEYDGPYRLEGSVTVIR